MLMHTASLYITTVLIWGSTFFAIRFQLGEVAPEVSVAYRFALAAAILAGWCWLRKLPMRFSLHQHFWMMVQGSALFGVNYLVVYQATALLTSGLIAVIFSTIVLMNIVNGALFFRTRPTPSVIAGALLGLVGISLVFLPELRQLDLHGSTAQGILLSLLATFIASLGNMIANRNQKAMLPIVQTNTFGMAYGALILAGVALLQGTDFHYDSSFSYSVSLLYLALFGSILAFGSYLTLLGRIGAERAAYAMVLFPIVALGISTLFEGYTWSAEAGLGVVLVLMGNVLMLISRRHLKQLLSLLSRTEQHPQTNPKQM